MGDALPLLLHQHWLPASAAQQQPPHAPLWRPDEEHSDHSETKILQSDTMTQYSPK